MKRKIQIGIIGSSAKKFNIKTLKLASEIGKEIAKNNCILVFGEEEIINSISQIAAESAVKYGGEAVSFLHDNNRKSKIPGSIKITTGQNIGGGREFSFILSCDVVISLAGGSGTLMEIAIAYQANIPVIVLSDSGGWSGKLAGKFLDSRKRQKIISSKNPSAAVATAIELAKKYNNIY